MKVLQSALHKTISTAAAGTRRSAIGGVRALSGKEIKFGVEGRASMLNGVNLLADAVQVSLFIVFCFFFQLRNNIVS
jgi:hypothetical protein